MLHFQFIATLNTDHLNNSPVWYMVRYIKRHFTQFSASPVYWSLSHFQIFSSTFHSEVPVPFPEHERLIFTPRDPQLFEKYRSHLGLVGARWMIWSKPHTDDTVLEWPGKLTDIWRYFSCMLTDTHCYMQGEEGELSIYAENVRRRLRKCIRLVFVHSCSQPYKWDEVIV